MSKEQKVPVAPYASDAATHMNIKVLGDNNAIVQFRVKRSAPFQKMMNAYCDYAKLSIQAIRFRFDGFPIQETDTPISLKMEDGDTVEVFQPQMGGVR